MYAAARYFIALWALAVVCFPATASAWVETRLRSDVATLDVDADGSATVTHELVLGVRGGPLKSFRVDGVDSDAEPLPDATVTVAKSGATSSAPIPLLLQKRDDGALELEIDHEKGLRTGVYLFVFRYRTELLKRQLIHREGAAAEVRWVGPRFADGLDAARVIFRLPPGPNPPKLVDRSQTSGLVDRETEAGGVFIANLRRAADKDELEVVRPHVASGEPVPWHISADARIFKAFSAENSESPDAPSASSALKAQVPTRGRLLGLLALIGVALGYALLVHLKAHKVKRAAEMCGASARALIKLPLGIRAACAGTLLAAAFAVGYRLEEPTLGALLLIAAMLFAAQVSTPQKVTLRGPGKWLPISDGEAFAKRTRRLPGRYLDAGTLPGAVTLLVALTAFIAALLLVLPASPYHLLLTLLASTCLLPIFGLGRASELPADPAILPRKKLKILARKLRKNPSLKVVAWGRIPEAKQDPDELRLLIQLRDAPSGFVAIELGFEYQHATFGTSATPYVMLRVREGSVCRERLSRDIVWTRGRKPEERAAVLRPKLPSLGFCAALVQQVTAELSNGSSKSSQPPNSSAMSFGRGSSTAKPATVPSPAHAT
jgi:hypothetical protein